MDQIDVAVNAPEAGTIKEFLASEEDTVTVGQDLVRLELGGAPPAGDKEEPAPKDDSAPPKKSEPESKPESKQESEPKPAPPASKPEPPKQSEPKQSKSDSAPPPSTSGPVLGSREERRVCTARLPVPFAFTYIVAGQDEPYASPHCRAPQAVSEHRCLSDHVQRGRHVQHHGVPQAIQG
jgi:2-oxoglutarate dehydrogenase E2 component (dihydrolipoamide succinyltransferase)